MPKKHAGRAADANIGRNAVLHPSVTIDDETIKSQTVTCTYSELASYQKIAN